MALTEPLLIGPDRNGRRIAIAEGLIVASSPEGARVLSCGSSEIAAGAVCAHTHLYSGLARYGMPAASPSPQNFVQIL